MSRTNEQARAGIPMSAEQVREVIAEMERARMSAKDRKAFVVLAIRIAKVTEEGREVWRRYAAELA